MKRLLYKNKNKELAELRNNEYIYSYNGWFKKYEYFIYTKDKIKSVYKNKNNELIAESSRHIWNLNEFSYLDKITRLKEYTDIYSILDYEELHPFKEYSTLCMEILKNNLKECKANRYTVSSDWMKDQYNYNLFITENPDKLKTIINYIYYGNQLNDKIISNKLNWLDDSYIKKMDEIFQLSPKLDKDIIVYRGISITPDKFDIKQFDKRYVSTSLFKEQAMNFSGKNGILMVIKLKKGTSALICFTFSTEFKNEAEILLPRKLKFRITKKSLENDLNIYNCNTI